MAAQSKDPDFFVPKSDPGLGWTINPAHPERGRFLRGAFTTYTLVGAVIVALIAAAFWISR